MSVTTIILAVTTYVSISAFGDSSTLLPSRLRHGEWFDKLMFDAYKVAHGRQYYRMFSVGLLHSGWDHLIFNMLTLYFFGYYVEEAMGAIANMGGSMTFLLFYVSALAVSSIPDLMKHKDNPCYTAVGASGAISAVLFAAILLNPNMGIMFFFIPVPIKGYIFGIIYIAYSVYMAKKGTSNVAHSAHIAGAVYGFLFPLVLESGLFGRFLEQI